MNEASQQRLAILIRDGLEQRYVANVLIEAFPVACVIVDRRQRKANVRGAMKRGVAHFLNKAARSVFLAAVRDQRRRERALRTMLGEKSVAIKFDGPIEYVDGINSKRVIKLLKNLKPTSILVYGTSIVKDSVLGLADGISFNMHTGISPYYRGTSCAFWPIANGEFDMLGATIHECTSRVDGGQIFEITRVECHPGDSLHTVFGRAVIAGAQAYVAVLKRQARGELVGAPQDLDLGREYLGSELTLGAELRARLRLARYALGGARARS